MSINFTKDICSWDILSISHGQQFYNKGIREGWKIKSVDGHEMNEKNRSIIYHILTQGESCSISFAKVNSLLCIFSKNIHNLSKQFLPEKATEFVFHLFCPIEM
jgi:hypothetical protein